MRAKMDMFGPFVAGDEFVGQLPGNSGMARLVQTNDAQSPMQLIWAPGKKDRRSRSQRGGTEITTRVTTVQNLYDGLCGDYVKPMNKELQLGQLVAHENGQKGEVIGVDWIATVAVPLKNGVAMNVPFSKLEPVTDFYKGERVYQSGWLGVVTRVIHEYRMANRFGIHCQFILRNGLTEIPNFDFPISKSYTLRNGQHFELPPHYMEDILWINLEDSQRLRLREPNCYKDFRVLDSKILKVCVTWIARLPESTEPEPNAEITGSDLDDIAHFDTSGIAHCLKVNYSCFTEPIPFNPPQEYPIMKRRRWKKELISRLFRDEPMEVEDNDTDDEKENSPAREPNLSNGSIDPRLPEKAIKGKLADGDIVDALHLLQVATVAWENHTRSEVMSRDLKRLSVRPCQQFRQFVQLKGSCNPDLSHGVTVMRNLESGYVQVQWYTRTRADWPALELKGEVTVVEEHQIEPHPVLGGIKIGELVVKNHCRPTYYLNRNPAKAMLSLFRFGIVTEVDVSTGAVIVNSVSGREYVIWPDDLLVIPALGTTILPPIPPVVVDPMPKLPNCGAGGDTGSDTGASQEIRTSFSAAFQLAYQRDIDLLQSPNHGLPPGTLIRKFEDSANMFCMLVIGPARTPYEDGIFLFDIILPVTYPLESPSFLLKSTFCNLISYNVDHRSMVNAPFLTGWTGVDKWHSGCTLADAIVSVIRTIFVPEPAENAINTQCRRYVLVPEVSGETPATPDLNRRGQFNLMVQIEVWDSLIRMAFRPTWKDGYWNDVIKAHLKDVFPRVVLKALAFIQAADTNASFKTNLARVGYSVPIPIPEGFYKAVQSRIAQLRTILSTGKNPDPQSSQAMPSA